MTMRRFYFILAAVLVLAAIGFIADSQTTPTLTPVPKMQFFDNNGKPLAGGLIYTYAAGTTTPLATYTDSTGVTPNTNPVILDPSGRANIWLGNQAYKFTVQTSLGVPLYTTDGITGSGYTNTLTIGSNLTLSNGATTAFNAHLLPGSASTWDVGNIGLPWNNGWFSTGWFTNVRVSGSLIFAGASAPQIDATGNAGALQLNGSTSVNGQIVLNPGNVTGNSNVLINAPRGDSPGLTIVDSGLGNGGTESDIFQIKNHSGTLVWKIISPADVGCPNCTVTGSLFPLTGGSYSFGNNSSYWGGAFINNVNVKATTIYGGVTFASLGTPAAGTQTYCTDCTIGATCTGAGTGAWAFRTATPAWTCPW